MSSEPSNFSSVTNPGLLFQGHKLANLTIRDWGELCEYYAFEPYRLARKHGATKEELEDIFYRCVDKKQILDPNHSEIIKYVISSNGYPKALELSFIRGGLTRERAVELIESQEEALTDIAFEFYALIGYDLKPKEKSANPPTPNQSDL